MGRRKSKRRSWSWLYAVSVAMFALMACLALVRCAIIFAPGVAAVAQERVDQWNQPTTTLTKPEESRDVAAAPEPGVRLAVLMMMRDEEALIRDHLPLWLDLAYCAVGAVDDRTVDGSALAFALATDGLGEVGYRRRFVYYYRFEGLGAARTLMISETLARFDATHALFIDPDWRPLEPAKTTLLQLEATVRQNQAANVFVFKVLDRNEQTERLLDWCFRLTEGVYFKYRWHEELKFPVGMEYTASLIQGWVVEEVAGSSSRSWHRAAHGSDRSAGRYEFEIALLEQDLKEFPDDPRLHYYLGVDYLALGEASGRQQDYRERSLGHLERHVAQSPWGYDGTARSEMTYVALLQLAQLRGEAAYFERAEAFDPGRIEAPLYLARLLRQQRDLKGTLRAAQRAARLPATLRLFYHHARAYICDAPAFYAEAAIDAGDLEEAETHLSRLAGCLELTVGDAALHGMITSLPSRLAALKKQPNRPAALSKAQPAATAPVDSSASAWTEMEKQRGMLPIASHDCSVRSRAAYVSAGQLWQRHEPVEATDALFAASKEEPQCCTPFREFTRLFMGENPDFRAMSLTKLADLETHLTRQRSSEWAELVSYALSSLKRHRGDLIGAAEELRPMYTTGGGAAAGTFKLCQDCPVRCATVASDTSHAGLRELEDSALRGGLTVEVLLAPADYTGHELKLRLVHDWVASVVEKDGPGAMVLFVDAYDVVFWPAVSEITRRFAEMDADVVFGAESSCYPDQGAASLYGKSPAHPDDRIYVNSGTIAATAGALLATLKAAFDMGTVALCGPDDQRVFHRLFVQQQQQQQQQHNPGLRMVVDSESRLFQTLHREIREMAVDATGQLVVDEQRPCLSHGNGGDGKATYKSAVRARGEAVSRGAAVRVEPALFMRGLELHRRGFVDAASADWRRFLETRRCGDDHFTTALYNLGFSASDPTSAIGFYERALVCSPTHTGTLHNIGVHHADHLGDLDTALSYLQEACRLDPLNEMYATNANNILLRRREQASPQ